MKRAMCIRRGGAEYGRAKVGVANSTWPIQDGEREIGSPRLRGYEIISVIKRERRPGVKQRRESAHKKKGGKRGRSGNT